MHVQWSEILDESQIQKKTGIKAVFSCLWTMISQRVETFADKWNHHDFHKNSGNFHHKKNEIVISFAWVFIHTKSLCCCKHVKICKIFVVLIYYALVDLGDTKQYAHDSLSGEWE